MKAHRLSVALAIIALLALVVVVAASCKGAEKEDPAHGLDKAPAGSPGPNNVPPVAGPKTDGGAAKGAGK